MPEECAIVFFVLLFVTTLCVTTLCVTALCVTGGIVSTLLVPLDDVDSGKGDDELGILSIPGNNKVPNYSNTSLLLLQRPLNILFQ